MEEPTGRSRRTRVPSLRMREIAMNAAASPNLDESKRATRSKAQSSTSKSVDQGQATSSGKSTKKSAKSGKSSKSSASKTKFKKPSSKEKEDGEEGDDDMLYCVCLGKDDKTPMIQCEGCQNW
jgi:hypothetical protein